MYNCTCVGLWGGELTADGFHNFSYVKAIQCGGKIHKYCTLQTVKRRKRLNYQEVWLTSWGDVFH